jgi:uncharacterized protein YlzI (FlbEa/FlbD family)
MTNFFRVTDSNDTQQFVSASQVRSVCEYSEHGAQTLIIFANGEKMYVKESINTVMAAIRTASPSG